MTKKYKIMFILSMIIQSYLFSATITSANSGSFNSSATWLGGTIPITTDSIIIASGHTVFLSTNTTTITSITINAGGVFDNAGFPLTVEEQCWGCGGTSFIIYGDYIGSGKTVYITEYGLSSNIISGSGTINTTGNWEFFKGYGATILPSANLTITNSSIYVISTTAKLDCKGTISLIGGNIYLSAGSTGGSLRNYGTINLNGNLHLLANNSTALNIGGIFNIGGDITGYSTGGSFNNQDSSILNVKGKVLLFDISGNPIGNNSQLRAHYPGNIVNYCGNINQIVKNPNIAYWHLNCTNRGNKSLKANITVRGNISILDSAQLDASINSYNIDLKGNWINTSTNSDPFVEQNGLITVSGAVNQSITVNTLGGETFYNLRLNNSSTGLTQINNNINITNTLTLNNGIINTGIYQTNITNPSLIAISAHSDSTYINGNLKRNLLSTGGSYDFPVGNSTSYQLANVNILGTNNVNDLLVNFSNLPLGSGLPVAENANIYSNILNCGGIAPGSGNADGGVWSITTNTGTATYDLTLYGRNYSNSGAINTVIKRTNSSSNWQITGTYMPSSGVEPLITSRSNFSGFSQFAIGSGAISTSIKPELNNVKTLKVYPNPASNTITIDLNNNDQLNLSFQIIDIYGKLVKLINVSDFNNDKYILDISKYNSGTYVLKLNKPEGNENIIFIKQ